LRQNWFLGKQQVLPVLGQFQTIFIKPSHFADFGGDWTISLFGYQTAVATPAIAMIIG
jgi:hypothetical protein